MTGPSPRCLAGGFGAGAASDEEDDAALDAEFEQQQAEEDEAMAAVLEHQAKERRKGAAVRSQRKLYDQSLEVRILLQRAVTGANRLPRPDARAAAASSDGRIHKAYSKVVEG